jgi:hypothetical protein
MKQIGIESQTWLTPSEGSRTQKKASDEAMAEYIRLGRLLLGSYRKGEANDPEVYVSGVVRILAAYPLDVVRRVVDPLDGLPSTCDWLPKFSEVKAACEKLVAPGVIDRMTDWKLRSAHQIAERERIAALPAPKQSYADFRDEMAARGLPIERRDRRIAGTAEAVRAKFGITQEQWDAMPDIPEATMAKWERR